jgi:sulfite reductase beta subunit-like hemoprotein
MQTVKTINLDISLGELELALSERELSKDELAKYKNELLGGERLKNELEDLSRPDVEKDLKINLKPNGIYIQFDRELIKKSVREWSFMVRDTVWGGGDISWEDWLQYSRLADLYSTADDGSSSIRLTTRQNFQFHRVSKKNLVPLIKSLIKIGKPSLNGCGDNTRNPVACPHKSDIFNANELAQKIGKYFQLPLSEHYKVFGEKYLHTEDKGFKYSEYGLPRKFKIGIGGYYDDEELKKEVRCNCGDILTNDLAIVPIIKNKKVNGYQIYIGGGLGQKNGKPTFPSLAGPLGILSSEEALMKGLDAIVTVQQQIGDRKNRHWARLKNILISKGLEKSEHTFEAVLLDESIFNEVRNLGIEWFKEQLESLGVCFLPPIPLELGKLNKHHGWKKQHDGNWSFGLWIQNGRISDTNPQGKIKSLIDELVSNIKPNVRIAPTQDILFTDIEESSKEIFDEILKKYNYGKYSKLRLNSEACVGLYTCPLAVAESEKYFDPLISELESLGYSDVEGVSIGISGCERHCSRNIRYGISLEGKGDSFYQLKLLLGRIEDDHLAQDLIFDNKKYLKLIPRTEIPNVISVLVDNYTANKNPDEEEISIFHKRIGISNILDLLKNHDKTSALLEKTYDPFIA